MKGFTIIEMMIAMFIGSIVMGGTYKAFQNQRIVYKQQQLRTELNNDKRLAVDFMQRYIRNAGIRGDGKTYAGVGPGIVVADKNITIRSDFNMDGTIDTINNPNGPSETTIFQYDNTGALGHKIRYCPGSVTKCALLLNHIDPDVPFEVTLDTNVPAQFVTIAIQLKTKNTQLNTDVIIPKQSIRIFIPNQGFQ